jgi:hypothetical protein
MGSCGVWIVGEQGSSGSNGVLNKETKIYVPTLYPAHGESIQYIWH